MSETSFMNNEVLVIIMSFVVALYASLVRVDLPEYIKKLFRNDIFRIIFLSLLLIYSFDKAPHVAIAVAIVFVITLHFLNYLEAKENFILLETFKTNMKKKKYSCDGNCKVSDQTTYAD